MNQPPEQHLTITTPPDAEAGVYADFVNVWHGPECFILDFAAMARKPEVIDGEDGRSVVSLAARVVSRVRIPPSQVFEIMKALSQQLHAWEIETGRKAPDPDA